MPHCLAMSLIRIRVPMARPLMRCNLKRFLRVMPSLLLLLFVFSLIFVTLMQIAIIHSHRRNHYAPRQESPNTTLGTYPLPSVYSSTQNGVKSMLPVINPTTKSAGHKRPETLRVEAFLDKNAPTVEANVVILQNLGNVVRIRQILDTVKTTTVKNCGANVPEAELGDHSESRRANTPQQQQHSVAVPSIHRPQSSAKNTFRTTVMQHECRLHENAVDTVRDGESKRKHSCPSVPRLAGRLKVNLSSRNLTDLDDLLRRSPYMRGRGSWTPRNCTANHRVAIIIPYRDRMEHLATLLYILHPLLQRQLIEYRVFVVEQHGNDTFNKGVLMNAGVKEALRQGDFHCFVFHDVDMIPEDDRNMYTCPPMPRHMSVAVDKFNYTLPYNLLVGGVFSIRLDHYLEVNGYSNLYWGWGGEDDDMGYRIKYKKLEIIRPPESLARYTMIKHNHRPESPNAIRRALLRMAKKRSPRDGLNTVKYRVVWRRDYLPYTHLMIDIGHNHRWQFLNGLNGQRLIINF